MVIVIWSRSLGSSQSKEDLTQEQNEQVELVDNWKSNIRSSEVDSEKVVIIIKGIERL